MPPRQSFDIITIGSALRDIMFYTDAATVLANPTGDPTRAEMMCVEHGAKIRSDNVHFTFGGGAANTAVNFAGLGLRVGIIASVGNDVDGEAIVQNLVTVGVDTAQMQRTSEHRTGISFLLVDEKRRDHAAFVYYGATQDLRVDDAVLQAAPTSWYYLASLNTSEWRGILDAVFGQKKRVAWNPGGAQIAAGVEVLKPYLERTAILILNTDEAAELVGHDMSTAEHAASSIDDMMKQLVAWGPEIVVLTDGRNGSYACNGKACFRSAAAEDHPVDTTGAGDCYGSSFVTGMIKYNGDVERSMRLAAVNASSAVQSVGAQSGLLKWNALPAELQR